MKKFTWILSLCCALFALSVSVLSADTVSLSVPNTNMDGVVENYLGYYADATSNVVFVGNYWGDAGADFHGVYKFEVAPALAGETITSAKLYVYCNDIVQDATVNAAGVGIKLQHYLAENSTNIEAADYTKTVEDITSLDVSATGWIELDVTNAVSADVAAGFGYTSFEFAPTDSASSVHYIRLAELSYASASAAYIVVQYGTSTGVQVASWPGDFASTQGSNNWYYLYATNDVYDSSETAQSLTWNETNSRYEGGFGVSISNGIVLPGELHLDGSTRESAVLRWVSPVNSNLRITGAFQKVTAYPTAYGYNGVICTIRVNGNVRWSQEILSPDTNVYSFDIMLMGVMVGDDVDLVVYPGLHNWVDETSLTATIETVETLPVLASWPAEYSWTQGENNWYYLYARNNVYNASETAQALTWDETDNRYEGEDGAGFGVYIANGITLPGELYLDGSTRDSAVLRWVSEIDSNLHVTGSFQKRSGAPAEYGVNGVICYVLVNGATKWRQEILSDDVGVYSFDLILGNVNVGDDVDFVVYPGVHNWLDETYMSVVIEPTEEAPTTASWPNDYSSSQGDSGWYYLYAENNDYNPSETAQALTWDATDGRYEGDNALNISGGILLPGDVFSTGIRWDSAVLRWVSYMDSDVRVTGSFQQKAGTPTASGLNGVVCEIRVNGIMVWYQKIESEDVSVYPFDIVLPNVTSGDDIDFVVGAGWHNWLDETYVIATISEVETKSPVFTPGGKYISGPTSITISSETASAAIYYTDDGTTPTTSSTPYSGPVSVTDGMTLKAIAVGEDTSAVSSLTFVVPASGSDIIGTIDADSGKITQDNLQVGNPYTACGIIKLPVSEYDGILITDARLNATAIMNKLADGEASNYFVLEHFTFDNDSFLNVADATSSSVELVGGVETISDYFTSFSWDVKPYVEQDLAAGRTYSAFRIVRTDAAGNSLVESDNGTIYFGDNVYLTVNTLPDVLDRGHQILLRRGLQIRALAAPICMDESVAGLDLDRVADANFTMVDLPHWHIEPDLMDYVGDAPGAFWGRLTGPYNYVTNTVQSWELPYLSHMISLQFKDEQDLTDSGQVDEAVAWMAQTNARYPHLLAYTNQSGRQFSVSVLENYMSQAEPDAVMFDAYPFNGDVTGGSPTVFYECMQKYRLLGLAGNDGTGTRPIPYGLWLQLVAYDGISNHMITESEMRLNQMSAWAFGYKFVESFTYNDQDGLWTGGGFMNDAVLFTGIDDSTPRQPQYDNFKNLSAESLNLGPALVRLLSTEVRMIMGQHEFLGFTVANTTPDGITTGLSGADLYLTGASATNLGSKNDGKRGDVIVGFFEPLDESFDGAGFADQAYFMVVNGLTDGDGTAAQTQQSIRLTFDFGSSGITSLQRLSRTTGELEAVSLVSDGGSVYHLDLVLDGGTGDLFKYDTGAPFVGIDAVPAVVILPGDANLDGSVDVGDLGILAANYGTTSGATWGTGDFNGDGAVDVGDLGILAANYGSGSSSSVDFDADYAQVFGESTDQVEADSDAVDFCGALGLPLIIGIALMGLMLVKLKD